MTIEELKEYIKPLIFFGKMKFEVTKTEDGFKVDILDHEEGQLINAHGEVVDPDYSSTTRSATFYTDEDGEVNFIEHGMLAFTRANKNQVILLANLIGQRMEVAELTKLLKETAEP